jgi:ribose-phosphate pyrophosphokinase
VGSINELKRQGAGDIYVSATHGIFSGPAITRLQAAPIEECVVTDAIPCFMADRPGSKIKTITVADELAEAIHHVYVNEPTTAIFGGDLNL